MTPLEKIDAWLDDIKKDLEGKGVAGYAAAFVYDKLRELKESMQVDAMKTAPIPPHPLPPSPAAQQLITKVMPIRDQIACMAMSGMLANPSNLLDNLNPEYIAETAYDYATSMISEGNIQV